jgi:hypothetical protein
MALKLKTIRQTIRKSYAGMLHNWQAGLILYLIRLAYPIIRFSSNLPKASVYKKRHAAHLLSLTPLHGWRIRPLMSQFLLKALQYTSLRLLFPSLRYNPTATTISAIHSALAAALLLHQAQLRLFILRAAQQNRQASWPLILPCLLCLILKSQYSLAPI